MARAIPGSPAWKDFADGTAVCDVWFRSELIPDAVFAGQIRLTKPVDGGDRSDAILLVDPSQGGATSGASFDDGAGYAVLEGELFGRGALDGVMLRLDSAKGSTVRRGSWRGADGETVQDAVFARFQWTSEGASVRGIDVPSKGNGTVAFKLRPSGRQ